MKINITTQEPDKVQQLFLRPIDFEQRVEIKKMQIVEVLLAQMEDNGMNRTNLAEKMGVSNPRITSMLNGSNNFTIETLMKAAEAVDGELELTIAPKDHQVRWVVHRDNDCYPEFQPQLTPVKKSESVFTHPGVPLASTDPCDAA